MPTVPVRASCVPLAGQAACIAALGSAVPGCGAVGCGGLGSGVLTCAVCTGGDAEGASRAGVLGDDDDGDSSDCVLPCSAGGVAWARTPLAPAAASAT